MIIGVQSVTTKNAESKYHTFKLNLHASEIDQQPHFDTCCLQFVEKLRFIRGLVCLGNFQFNQHDVVHQQISTIFSNGDVFVLDFDLRLRLTTMPSLDSNYFSVIRF